VKKSLAIAFCVIAVLWVLGCGAIYHAMRQPPESFGRFMSRIPAPVAFLVFPFETLWTHARAGSLAVGDSAPDFTLTKLDKSAQVQLSSLTAQGKPVALIFGSYT
jgi:cytosine/uracil/thiamine/allantoin permease